MARDKKQTKKFVISVEGDNSENYIFNIYRNSLITMIIKFLM